MMLQSLSGIVAASGYCLSGIVAMFYFVEVSNVRNIPFQMRFSILVFAVFNVFTALSALGNVSALASEVPRAMAETLLSSVLFWRALNNRSERKCQTLHLQTS